MAPATVKFRLSRKRIRAAVVGEMLRILTFSRLRITFRFPQKSVLHSRRSRIVREGTRGPDRQLNRIFSYVGMGQDMSLPSNRYITLSQRLMHDALSWGSVF